MIQFKRLEPFKFYKLSGQLIMPESTNRKKNVLYTVLAPSIESELNFLSNETQLTFRFLYKYFIEKVTIYKPHGKAVEKVINAKNGELFNLLTQYTKGNLKNIDGVTSYNEKTRINSLKNFNLLYEFNHIIELILNNDKDRRLSSAIGAEIFNMFDTYLNKDISLYQLSNYTDKYIIIPINLWIKDDEKDDVKIFSKTSRNFIGMIYNVLKNQPDKIKIFKDYKIILTNNNEVMVLDPNILPEKKKTDFYADCIRIFTKKCKTKDGDAYITGDAVSEIDDEVNVDAAEIVDIEASSNTELVAEETLDKAKINIDELPTDKRDELIKVMANAGADTSAKSIGIRSIEDVDDVVGASLSGKSILNYQRDKILKEKYKTLTFAGKTFEDIVTEEAKYDVETLETHANTVNPALKSIVSHNFEKAYNEQLSAYDCANILLHFNNVKPPMYLISDPIIEDISDTMNKLYTYTVEYEDENRKRHKFSFKMPKMYQDKYLFINESKWDIVHQKVPFPVTKVDADVAQVATNYNKIFLSRYGANISSKVTKLKKILSSNERPKNMIITDGNATLINKGNLTTIEFDELGSTFYQIRVMNTLIYFNIDEAMIVIGAAPKTIKEDSVFPIAIDNKTKIKYYLSGETNKVYDDSGKEHGELSDFVIDVISQGNKDFKDKFDGISVGTKFTYTRAMIMGKDIPLVVLLGAADPGGLRAVLDKAKVNYTVQENRPSNIDKDNQGVIPFDGSYLIFDRYPYENSLLLNGLSAIPTKEFKFEDMGNRDTYLDIFEILYNRRNLIDGIENFYYLLIDPITLSVLQRLDMPQKFTELLLYANGKLADNTFEIDAVYNNCRLRSNEIINVLLYQELCKAYASYKIGRSPKFSIPEDCIIKDLLSERLVDAHSRLNVTLEIENDRQVKMKGPVGMNVDRAFTLTKRAYHPSMRGIIAMNSTPSGEVGINRHLTLNANISDARGFLKTEKEEYDGTELISPGEMLNVFGVESADIERVAMAVTQSKHLVPTAKSGPSLVSYDMERIIPYISHDFAFTSKDDGEVIDIAEDIMIVKYKDGKIDDVDLSKHPDKNTDGGLYIMNGLTTDLKVGSKFAKNQVLAYDEKYISKKDYLGDNNANIGTLARVAIVSNGNVYEDATYFTDKLGHDLATKITLPKDIVVSKYSNIKYMVKKGQDIQANDPLIIFDDTNDEFTSNLLASIAEESEDEDQIIANTTPVVSKITGKIVDIKIYHTIPIEDMTPSLRKIVNDYNKDVNKREKFISKYKDIKDANTILTPGKQVEPDSTGRVKGVKVGDGVLIEFFMEYLDIMGVGDKLTNLK